MEALFESSYSWLENITGYKNLWIIEAFIIVLATLVIAMLARRSLARLVAHSQRTKSLWDDALFEALLPPTRWFIWLLGLSWAALVVGAHADSQLFNAVPIIRKVGVVVIVTWFITGLISRAERNLMDPEYSHKPMDKTTATAMGKLLRISVVITAALVILQSLGYSISGVLAFGGIGGIAIGFAAKDLLANFFGGLMIYLDRPFAVGDWVRSPDKEIEGVVENIGWRLTCIRSFDKRPLYVPNATFTQITVQNPSRMTHRRIFETIGVRYDDAHKIAAIIDDVKNMLTENKEIDTESTYIVNFNAFGASSLDFFVYCLTKTTDWVHYHTVKQDVLLKILAIIENHGAECAFPTRTLHMPEGLQIDRPVTENGQSQ